MNIGELLDALALAPRLTDPACAGQWPLFDVAAGGRNLPRTKVIQAQRDALAVCRACPALAECRDWINTVPPNRRPSGVVAGRLDAWVTAKTGKPGRNGQVMSLT